MDNDIGVPYALSHCILSRGKNVNTLSLIISAIWWICSVRLQFVFQQNIEYTQNI